MGDGKINKYAVILNGSAETLALQEIRRVSGFFEKNGYDMFVASPEDRLFNNTYYFEPTSAGMVKLAGRVLSLVDDDDEVVIYGGGHGDKSDGGCLKMKDRCVSKTDPVFTKLFNLPAGKRAVIMNMCFSGNWANLFIDDPKTFFVSAGSCGEEVLFDDFDRSFFANEKKIKDADKDGKISWRDRFLHTARQQRGSRGCYVGSQTKSPAVAGDVRQCSRFLPKTYQARSVGEYEGLLKQLRDGDLAVVMIGIPSCGRCKTYSSQFRKMAERPMQTALFIEIPNGEDDRWSVLREKLKIEAYPSVFLADAQGHLLLIEKNKMDNPLADAPALKQLAITPAHDGEKPYRLFTPDNKPLIFRDAEMCFRTSPRVAKLFGTSSQKEEEFQNACAGIKSYSLRKICQSEKNNCSELENRGLASYCGRLLSSCTEQLNRHEDKIIDEAEKTNGIEEKTRLTKYLEDAWNLADGMVEWARENNHWYNRIDEAQLLGVLAGYSHLKDIPNDLQGLRDYEGKARQMLRELVSTHTGREAAKEEQNSLTSTCDRSEDKHSCYEGYYISVKLYCSLITGETFTESYRHDHGCWDKPRTRSPDDYREK